MANKKNRRAVMANRTTALQYAAELLEGPTHYRAQHEATGHPEPAGGIRGAFGATNAPAATKTDSNDYADSLIALAEYITGDNQ